jgi:hypothetical protein
MILLTVQAMLFMPRNMTIMPVSHPSFFPPDPVILTVQVMRFTPAHVPAFHLMMNATVLIIQSVVYFCPAWMIFCKAAILGHGNICESKKCYKKRGE